MEEIILFSEYLTLGQALKEVGAISTGGQAKYFLKNHTVFVNDQPEDRRGRKLYNNDTFTLSDGKKILLRNPTTNEEKIYKKEQTEKKKMEEKVKQLNAQQKKSSTTQKKSKPRFPGASK